VRDNNDRGVIITLVAVFMLAVIGAMAAISIDVVTIYTARSEAQLAADGAALAGARVLASSGMTSSASTTVRSAAHALAVTVATQVAEQNTVGGKNLIDSNVTVSFPASLTTCDAATDPCISVKVQRNDLPTFFARIWGTKVITVGASATAEAFNPSGAQALGVAKRRVAPSCVKPWLLPNLDPTQPAGGATQIFDPTTGAIVNAGLLGQSWPSPGPTLNQNGLFAVCGDCSAGGGGILAPQPGQYYPGDIAADDFPAPTQALPSGSTGFNPYQLAVAGCVPRPIRCGAAANIDIDTNPYATNRDADTFQAASNLIHYNGAVDDSDRIDTSSPVPPFVFMAGNQNPVASAVGKDVMVSDSLVTIPVYNSTASAPPQTVTVIGFLQVFLNPTGVIMTGAPKIPATVINMVGCGTGATGQPVLGNGSSPVAVRLVSP
jgi:hypothetical protein